jgi:hypothetical protein
MTSQGRNSAARDLDNRDAPAGRWNIHWGATVETDIRMVTIRMPGELGGCVRC